MIVIYEIKKLKKNLHFKNFGLKPSLAVVVQDQILKATFSWAGLLISTEFLKKKSCVGYKRIIDTLQKGQNGKKWVSEANSFCWKWHKY